MKHIIYGGFDYAVIHEMNSDAVLRGIDYFVDDNLDLIGTTYLGKEIKHPEALLKENKEDIIILIGSIVHRTEIAYSLKEMGFEEGKNFIWGISFVGDDQCPRLWRHTEWNDKAKNISLKVAEEGEATLTRLKMAVKLIDWGRFNTLIDLGAANGRVRQFVPPGIRYIPVDYIRYSDATVLCDLNHYEFPSSTQEKYDPNSTCVISIGNIAYVTDWRWYLRAVAENCSTLILGIVDFVRIPREYRMQHWTSYSALFDHEVILYAQKIGFSLADAVDFRLHTTLYKFEKACK